MGAEPSPPTESRQAPPPVGHTPRARPVAAPDPAPPDPALSRDRALDELGIAPLVGGHRQDHRLDAHELLLVDLLENRIAPGVDPAAKVKAAFLARLARGECSSPLVSPERAVALLGTMLGGYNIQPLIGLIDDAELGELAAEQLKFTLLMFDAFHDVEERAKGGNGNAQAVLQSWADAEWFTRKDDVPAEIRLTVFKVAGETNTDDLSPAQDAWSRPDIPMHALAMLKNAREGIEPDEPGKIGPMKAREALKQKGLQLA